MPDVRLVVERPAYARLEPAAVAVLEASRREDEIDLLGTVIVVGVAHVRGEQGGPRSRIVRSSRPPGSNDRGVRVSPGQLSLAKGPPAARGAQASDGPAPRRFRQRGPQMASLLGPWQPLCSGIGRPAGVGVRPTRPAGASAGAVDPADRGGGLGADGLSQAAPRRGSSGTLAAGRLNQTSQVPSHGGS